MNQCPFYAVRWAFSQVLIICWVCGVFLSAIYLFFQFVSWLMGLTP